MKKALFIILVTIISIVLVILKSSPDDGSFATAAKSIFPVYLVVIIAIFSSKWYRKNK